MGGQHNSHNEIWDDSALQDSWNDALDEYKKYHSIAARGERLQDVIDAAENAEEAESVKVDDRTVGQNSGLPAWQSVDTQETVNEVSKEAGVPMEDVTQHTQEQPVQQSSVPQTAPSGPSSNMPQALLNSVQDENLKNLMMSWYYAGYYTGLNEGQQKSQAAEKNAP